MAEISRDKHDRVLMMAFEGCSTVEIAAAVGVTSGVIWAFLKSPEARSRLERMRDAFDHELGRAAAIRVLKAMQVLRDALDDPDPAIRMQAAVELLRFHRPDMERMVQAGPRWKDKVTGQFVHTPPGWKP